VQAGAQGFERVVTPEAVAVELDVAGLGSRMIAALIDGAIQTALYVVAALLIYAFHLGDTASTVLTIVAGFVILWGYFFIFEGLWHGRTPGKRAQRIRAVRTDGHPMSGLQMFVRNLVRIVDVLPAYYAIGAIAIVLTKRSQRIGDLAAGTLVIRERKATVPVPVPPPPVSVFGSRLDASGVSEATYQLVRSFLERRDSLEPAARQRVAEEIAQAVGPTIGTPSVPMPAEQLLEEVAAAYRARSGGSPNRPDSETPSAF
jgi:uncharacterized RDD family membrane protein YckC